MSVAAVRTRDTLRGLAWISPWLAGLLAFMVAPAALSLYYSTTDYTLLEAPVGVGLDNYREMLRDRLFGVAVGNTVVFALWSVVGTTLVSVFLAWMLEKPMRGAGLVRAIVFVPTLVPVVSTCITWLWMYNGDFGPINSALAAAKVDGPDWLGDRRYALGSLAVMGFWVIGSPLLVCSAAMREVPRSLYEAADLDGAGAARRAWHVTLPMISPAIMFNAVMSVIWSLQVFAPAKIMTNGGPENSTLVYSMYVYSNAFVYGRMGYACALAWVQMVITLVLALGVIGVGRRFVHYRAV